MRIVLEEYTRRTRVGYVPRETMIRVSRYFIGLAHIELRSCGEIELLVKEFLFNNAICYDAK